MLKKIIAGLTIILLTISFSAAQEGQNAEIRLIVRGDDMGMAHAVNQACIDAYQKGILTTVEVMVPCPWFPEAARMLNENPGLDVGIHLVLTSEWGNMKWRPLSHVPSLVNEEGYFYPTVWDVKEFPPNSNLLATDWKIEEVEKELRAQIELAMAKIPNISHLSDHMAFAVASPQLRDLVEKLAKEYHLEFDMERFGLQNTGNFGGSQTTPAEKEKALFNIVNNLKPGIWLFVDHPGYDTPEMQALGHIGYRNVAADRAGVTFAFKSKRIKNVIEKRKILLINYRMLRK